MIQAKDMLPSHTYRKYPVTTV